MVAKLHKAFELIGERVLIIDPTHRNKEGIFQESRHYQSTAECVPRPALDFIEPIYGTNPSIEELAKGLDPREIVRPENPILSLHFGLDHLKLDYRGFHWNLNPLKVDCRGEEFGTHVFEGDLVYAMGGFINDGNSEIYDRYREVLRNAGFRISSP